MREIGVAAGQGYLLSRPMPAPTLARVDLNLIEAGGVIMSAMPPLPPPPPYGEFLPAPVTRRSKSRRVKGRRRRL